MKIQEFASLLFDIEINSHIAHLQTDKYSDHMALNSLYVDIVDLRDRFIESYQGKYEIITGYKLTLKELSPILINRLSLAFSWGIVTLKESLSTTSSIFLYLTIWLLSKLDK